MKPLNIAVFVKSSPGATTTGPSRNMGWWSYAVPEFDWKLFPHNGGTEDLGRFKKYDLIWHEDSGYVDYANNKSGPPVIYYEIESAFTENHYKARLNQAKQADLVLVDWSPLEWFKPSGKKVIRFPFCVNDRVFYPREKTTDIAWHAATSKVGGAIRHQLTDDLIEICNRKGYSLRRGPLPILEYGASMGAARVVANQNRLPNIRAHRCFDAMACGAALITGNPTPFTSGDLVIEGQEYLTFSDKHELENKIDELLYGEWIRLAEAGYRVVSENHTWAVRASQLRDIIKKEFGI